MQRDEIKSTIYEKYATLRQVLDERTRRFWAGTEARALGYGGQTIVAEATGISRSTINIGLREIKEEVHGAKGKRIRISGGGRKCLTDLDPQVKSDLESLVGPTTRGDPESSLRWTCKSTRQLSEALKKKGHKIGRQAVARLLHNTGYSLQGNRKTREGSSHSDRDAQFRYISGQVLMFQEHGRPVVSVDTKKKELVGEFKNNGREWQPKGQPEIVGVYDFINKELGKVSPYGVYDQTANVGWVSVGIDCDTAEFAVESLRHWWYKMGRQCYPQTTELLVTADCGGSNGYRVRL